MLYTFEVDEKRIWKKSFNYVQDFSSIVNDALRALRKVFLVDICNAVLSTRLNAMAAKSECNWSTRLGQRPARLLARFDLYEEQPRDEASSYFRVLAAAKKSPSRSNADSATAFVRQIFTGDRPGSSSNSLQTSVAPLLQDSMPYSRLHNCASSDLVPPQSFDRSALTLDGAVRSILTDPPYSVRPRKQFRELCARQVAFRRHERHRRAHRGFAVAG